MERLSQNAPKYIKAAIIVLLFVLLGALIPGFLTINNLLNVVRQSSIVAVCAMAVSMVIIIRGIDLSTGGVISLSGMLIGTLLLGGVPLLPALLVTLAVGALFGLIDGVVIAKLHVPPFIGTYVFGQIALSFALLMQSGRSIGGFPQAYTYLGSGKILGVPVADVIMLVFMVAGILILGKTAFGNHIYSLGHSDTVVREEGINIDKIKVIVFALSGFCAAASGILLSAQLDAAHPTQGEQYQLDAVAACIIGGVDINGGQGRVTGAVLGAIGIGLIRNASNLLGLHPFVQNLVIGGIIIAIVGVSTLNKHIRRKSEMVF